VEIIAIEYDLLKILSL
jgi:hypothetical protein